MPWPLHAEFQWSVHCCLETCKKADGARKDNCLGPLVIALDFGSLG